MSPTDLSQIEPAAGEPLLARPTTGMRRSPGLVQWAGVALLAGLTTWLAVIGLGDLLAAGSLGRSLSLARGEMAGPTLLCVVGVLLVCERLWPVEVRPVLARGHLVDAGYLALFALAVVPPLTLVQTGVAVVVQRHASFLVLSRLTFLPRMAVAGIVLVGVDAMNWLAHRANHRFATLWRLHALHHSQEEMGVFTTFRTHPLVHSVYLVSLFPALVLSANGGVPAAAVIAYGCLVTLPHANLRWTFGPLGRVFVSPAYHRLHHARYYPGDGQAVNFGFVLVCWDRLARRAVFPVGPVLSTGLDERPVPVEQDSTPRRLPRTVFDQLAQPFRRVTTLEA